MGYTHYWEYKEALPQAKWNEFMLVNRMLVAKLPQGIGIFGQDGTGAPELHGDALSFNGDDAQDLSHETFHLSRTSPEWSFCKTARKPYDLLVCAVLLNLKHSFGERVVIDSDGGSADWAVAVAYYETVTERDAPKEGPWA